MKNLRKLGAACLGIAAVVTALAAGARADAPQRWALLVGVGDNISPENVLNGPNNDVPAMADLLRGQYAVPSSHLRQLMNRAATRQGILDGWAWLARSAKAGDLVFFYYSGHGTVLPESVPGSEPNGLDSAICPFDAVSRRGLIAGWEIGKQIDLLPTDQVVVIVDACNSGHATRDIRSRRRSIDPARFGVVVPRGARTSSPAGVGGPTTPFAGAAPSQHKEIYVGAARIDQSAIESAYLDTTSSAISPGNSGGATGAPNPNMGALTYYLLRELRGAAASGGGGALNYGELLRLVRRDLRTEYGDDAQEPQLSGPDSDTTPFLALRGAAPNEGAGNSGATALPVAVAVTAGTREGATLQLRAVAGAALIPGSVLQVSGAKRWIEAGDGGNDGGGGGSASSATGLVKVTRVNGATATGSILSGVVPAGFALTEVMRPAPEGRLRVAVGGDGAATQRLRAAASGIENVVVVESRRPSDVTLYPSLAAGSGADGRMVDIYRGGVALPPIPEAEVAATLAGMQRVKRLANLQSAPDAAIHIKVSSDGSEGFAKAKIGDRVSYRISTDHDAFITILDLTADGSVVGATRQQALLAGEEWVLTDIPVVAPAGLDTLKVIATAFPVTLNLPGNAEQSKSMGAAGKPAAVAQRVLDALRVGGIASGPVGNKGLDLGGVAARENLLLVGAWACADQLLRVDP